MLEGYKPLNFGGLPNLGSLPQQSLRNNVGLSNVAQNILANSQWKNTPISELREQGVSFTPSGEVAKLKHNHSTWSRFVDLLSIGNYTIANALDEGLAGHQSDPNDNALESGLKFAGGILTGAPKGAWSSLRGTFAPDHIAADPTDKTRFGDVAIRQITGMAADDAAKPGNWEKIKPLLDEAKNKSNWEKTAFDFALPSDLNTEGSQEQFVKNMHLTGIAPDIVADPINFIIPGGKGAAKGLAEVPETGSDIGKGFGKEPPVGELNRVLQPSKTNPSALGWGKTPGSYKVSMSPGAVQNQVVTSEGLTKVPDWFNFPASAADVPTSVGGASNIPVNMGGGSISDVLSSIASTEGRIKEPPNLAAKASPKQAEAAAKLGSKDNISKLTSEIFRTAVTSGPNWTKTAKAAISGRFPGVSLPHTTKFIDRMGKIPNFSKRIGIPAERAKIASALSRTISEDSRLLGAGSSTTKSAEDFINEAVTTATMPVAKPVPQQLTGQQSKLADKTIEKFTSAILGKGMPSGIKNPEAYQAAVASGKTAKYSGPQQVQMWNYITHNLPYKGPAKFNHASKILRQVEDHFFARGAKAFNDVRVANSVPLRLSSVVEAIGPAAATMNPNLLTKILSGDPKALATLSDEAKEAIEASKAAGLLSDSSSVIKGVEATEDVLLNIANKGPLSASRLQGEATIASKTAEDVTRAAGASPVGAKAAEDYVRNQIIPKTSVDAAISSKNLNTSTLISHPDVSGKLLRKYSNAPAVTKAIHNSLGGPPPKSLAKLAGPKALVPEWLGARFNAAYKNPDMRPTFLRNSSYAKSTVARRAKYLNGLAREFPVKEVDTWNDALKGAQGKLVPVAGTGADKLSKEILKVMEDLFGSSGLKNAVALENSVAGRSQLFMKELNESLKRFGLSEYQFSKAGDFAKGTNWLNSWEKWDIKNPLEFLFKMQNVVEHTVREKVMFDEIIARFGTYSRGGAFTHTVNHPRLANVYFGKEAASQANQFVKNLKELHKPNAKSMQMFDKVLSKWKAAVTIYVPSHHIRNMIGDTYFNWIAGVNSARPYNTALKVMQSQRGRYQGLEEMAQLTSPDALKKAISKSGTSSKAKGQNIAFTMKNGQKVTNDMVYVSAFQQGILPTTRVLEDIPDDVAQGLDKFRPLGGRGQKVAHSVSEGQNHYVRLAHYVDALKKSPKGFEGAVEDASAVVRKWHPDGMDLTKFERNVMRRIFPFYSWTRKAIPLIVESAAFNHQKVLAYPRAQQAGQLAYGDVMPDQTLSDPFPEDGLFPDWLREKGIGPMWSNDDGGFGIVNPGNPTMDTISSFSDPGKGALGMLNPGAKIPLELATGREAMSGAPIDGLTDTDYVAKNIPGVSHTGRATGMFGTSDTTKEQGFPNWQNIINLLTASGYVDTAPHRKSAEFDLREFMRSQR